jgi:ParB family chromosome partitioning protein
MAQKIQFVREMPLDCLTVSDHQVRVRAVDTEIDDLAESIRVHGLLEPIVVCPSANNEGQFDVLMGQRRLLAHQRLGRQTILAIAIDPPVDESTAKTLSLSENLIRRPLDNRDVIDACTALYRKYGNARAVAEETGLPYVAVLKHIKYDRLTPALREVVDSGEVKLGIALSAQDAVSVDGTLDDTEGVLLAKRMSAMTGVQRRHMLKAKRRKPKEPIETLLETCAASARKRQIIVTLDASDHQALQRYAEERKITQDEAAAQLVSDGLSRAVSVGVA